MEIPIVSSVGSKLGLRRYNLSQGRLTPAWCTPSVKSPKTKAQLHRREKAKAAKLARKRNR